MSRRPHPCLFIRLPELLNHTLHVSLESRCTNYLSYPRLVSDYYTHKLSASPHSCGGLSSLDYSPGALRHFFRQRRLSYADITRVKHSRPACAESFRRSRLGTRFFVCQPTAFHLSIYSGGFFWWSHEFQNMILL